jgi:hypothetical protein
VAKLRKQTKWYEDGAGRKWHVEVGSKAEDRMILEGFQETDAPPVAKKPEEIKPTAPDAKILNELADRIARLEEENAQLKEEKSGSESSEKKKADPDKKKEK